MRNSKAAVEGSGKPGCGGVGGNRCDGGGGGPNGDTPGWCWRGSAPTIPIIMKGISPGWGG